MFSLYKEMENKVKTATDLKVSGMLAVVENRETVLCACAHVHIHNSLNNSYVKICRKTE